MHEKIDVIKCLTDIHQYNNKFWQFLIFLSDLYTETKKIPFYIWFYFN